MTNLPSSSVYLNTSSTEEDTVTKDTKLKRKKSQKSKRQQQYQKEEGSFLPQLTDSLTQVMSSEPPPPPLEFQTNDAQAQFLSDNETNHILLQDETKVNYKQLNETITIDKPSDTTSHNVIDINLNLISNDNSDDEGISDQEQNFILITGDSDQQESLRNMLNFKKQQRLFDLHGNVDEEELDVDPEEVIIKDEEANTDMGRHQN